MAKAINRLDIARMGPLIISEIPYRKLNHNAIRGTTMPAPKASTALVKVNLTRTTFDLPGSKFLTPDSCFFNFFDSLTLSIIRVETPLIIAIKE